MKRVTRRSGNILADADDHDMKARLVLGIAKLIEARGLTKTAAAELIGISRPDLSKYLGGNFRPVSMQRLLDVARGLGSDVEIKITVRPQSKRRGRLSLVMA